MAAIEQGRNPPPELSQFYRDAAFWQQLGLRPDDLRRMPPQQVADYTLFIALLQRKQEGDARRAQAGHG